MSLAKGKLLAQSSVWSQDWMGLGRWGVLTQTPWEALLRPLFWPRVLVWLASWSVTPAPRQVPRALRMLAPQGWLPGNHSCLSPCPWVRGVRSVSPTQGTLRAECAHPRDSRNGAAFLREPKVTPRHQPHPSGSTPAEKPTLAPCIRVMHWTRLTPTPVFTAWTLTAAPMRWADL